MERGVRAEDSLLLSLELMRDGMCRLRMGLRQGRQAQIMPTLISTSLGGVSNLFYASGSELSPSLVRDEE